jgi:hypothetical protein
VEATLKSEEERLQLERDGTKAKKKKQDSVAHLRQLKEKVILHSSRAVEESKQHLVPVRMIILRVDNTVFRPEILETARKEKQDYLKSLLEQNGAVEKVNTEIVSKLLIICD